MATLCVLIWVRVAQVSSRYENSLGPYLGFAHFSVRRLYFSDIYFENKVNAYLAVFRDDYISIGIVL